MYTTNRSLTLALALFVAFASLVPTALFAQSDWKASKKKADEYYAKGEYPKAGNAYMDAYGTKPKLEFAEKAAECFTICREYAALANALEPLRSEKMPRAGFKYANALKQAGRYTDAVREFQLYINNYKGKDYDTEEKFVQMQIEGCHYALKQQQNAAPAPLRIARLCSDQTDYAPTLVGSTLYYATISNGVSTIFTAEKSGNSFVKPIALLMAKDANTHYGHPTLTEDGSRMYFTKCTNAKGATPTCQIYGMEQKNGKWSDPVKLPDFINLKDATTTQPFVTLVDKKEQLYFASNRKGGQGGLDIWVASRNIESDGFAFTLPINLGESINTSHDEVTPRMYNSTLYFSSDGYVGVGGYDIFSAKKTASGWAKPQNLGMPINSGADDTYYTPTNENDFLMVSNRAVKGEKPSSSDDDIFMNGTQLVVNTSEMANLSGKIIDAATRKGLDGVMFSLIDEISGKEILTKTVAETYSVNIYPAMKYRLEARKEGYKTASLNFRSADRLADAAQDVEMVRLTDYKGTPAKVPASEPIVQLSDPIIIDMTDDEPIEESSPVVLPESVANIESTVFYGDLTPQEKERIITINGKKVLPEPSGNKLVSMEALASSTKPQKTVEVPKMPQAAKTQTVVKAAVKTTTKPAVPPKKVAAPAAAVPAPADEDASNDEGGNSPSMSDTKEGTVEIKQPTTAAIKAGLSYKVQLASLAAGEKFVAEKFDYAKNLGATIETEPGPNGVGTRVVAVPTAISADVFLKKLKTVGKNGYKVKYNNGVRAQ